MFCESHSVVPSLKSIYFVVININNCFDKTQTNGKLSEIGDTILGTHFLVIYVSSRIPKF